MSKFKSKKDLTHKIQQNKENNKFHFKFPTKRRMEHDKESKLDDKELKYDAAINTNIIEVIMYIMKQAIQV